MRCLLLLVLCFGLGFSSVFSAGALDAIDLPPALKEKLEGQVEYQKELIKQQKEREKLPLSKRWLQRLDKPCPVYAVKRLRRCLPVWNDYLERKEYYGDNAVSTMSDWDFEFLLECDRFREALYKRGIGTVCFGAL